MAKMKSCSFCGGSFVPSNRGQRFCSIICRFQFKVEERPGRCWLWKGAKDPNGYGHFWTGTAFTTAHRVAFLLAGGKLEPQHDVCHSCDNPSCVNPNHLFLGTRLDNVSDCIRKGRFFPPPIRPQDGENNPASRLSKSDVLRMRKERSEGEKLSSLAERFGVVPSCVSRICNGLAWASV